MINFKIIIPFYNVKDYIVKCLESVVNQSYSNWQAVLIDDNSTDGSIEILSSYIRDKNIIEKFKVFKRGSNVGALENIVYGINAICSNDNDVIVLLDGDDWFYDNNVLKYLDEVYMHDMILATYGNFISSSGRHNNFCRKVDDIYNYRNMPWVTSHLRTFYFKVWKHVKEEDLKDEDGKFYTMAWDLAIMYPVLEIVGNGKFKFIEKFLYVYNDENPLNDYKKDVSKQLLMAAKIRSKPRYMRIEL